MTLISEKKIRIAIIDMNNGEPNQGMQGIYDVLLHLNISPEINLLHNTFNLRQKGEIPDEHYDIYISSGGPGSPYDGEGEQWENDFFELLNKVDAFNKTSIQKKKYVFLICHSFQMACRKYKIGQVIKRKHTAFGVFPVFLTEKGKEDLLFDGLPDPFYVVDSRDWQVIIQNETHFSNVDACVLVMEKERKHIDLKPCIMAIRFTKEIIGTQFHPEANAAGMKTHLLQSDIKNVIIDAHGHKKYNEMLASLDDPQRIKLTQRIILPNFLIQAINTLHPL